MQTYAESNTARRGQRASVQGKSTSVILDTACPAGVVVVPSAGLEHADLPSGAGSVALAIGVVTYDLATVAPSTANDFAADDVAEAVYEGDVWMVTETSLTKGAQPYCRHTTGTGTQLGALLATADTSTAELLPNCRVVEACSAAGIVKVRVNLPQGAAS